MLCLFCFLQNTTCDQARKNVSIQNILHNIIPLRDIHDIGPSCVLNYEKIHVAIQISCSLHNSCHFFSKVQNIIDSLVKIANNSESNLW